jgi:protein gp37
MEDSKIAWTDNTQNFWLGCDKIAPECAKCYIGRVLKRQGREPWGQLYRSKTWDNPLKWQRPAESQGICFRVFTNSLSDFFHADADGWREEAWEVIRRTPNLVYLILTKRPELIRKRLPQDWGQGWPNVWLGRLLRLQADAQQDGQLAPNSRASASSAFLERGAPARRYLGRD